MTEVMKTFTPVENLAALLLALPPTLACEVQNKQIGQLDDDEADFSHSAEVSDDGDECEDSLPSLQALLDEHPGKRCAAVIFFHYESFESYSGAPQPYGWHLDCNAGDLGLSVDEARALTSWGGQEISEPEDWPPEDASFLFYEFPDPVGGVGWVSNEVGLLFDASIVAGGVGEIYHPQELRDPSELGCCCSPLEGFAFEVHGYDLTRPVVVTDFQLPPNAYDELLGALQQTALWRLDLLAGPVGIVAYPRTVAEFDPNAAEYIVIVELEK
jgi:hypothetical protein